MKVSARAAWIVVGVAGLLAGCTKERAREGAAASGAAPRCAHPEPGCACEPGSPPLPCFAPDEELEDGTVLCHEGTLTCRDGRYGACEGLHSYAAPEESPLTSIVDPTRKPTNCGSCDVKCFSIVDPLLATTAGNDGGVAYGSRGGLQLAPGPGSGTADAGAGALGDCEQLALCCSNLTGADAVRDACDAVVTADEPADCETALELYCPGVVNGPVDGCTPGASASDSDCDGIPDLLDVCTAATALTNPDCNGSVLPLPSTNNQTLFHVLDNGETGKNSVQIGFRVKHADVYFLMDMSDTMAEEHSRLTGALTSGNMVDCALLKNCCDTITDTTKRALCMTEVDRDDGYRCQTQFATYCSAGGNTHCTDLDFDGVPDDQLKEGGVVGAIRCLLGNSWFGAGTFIEIPFRDGVDYNPFAEGGFDHDPFRDRGNHDEWAFKHYTDMTRDVVRLQGDVQRFKTNRNYEYPEAQIIALYSLLSGEGQTFGNLSPSIPARNGAGCPADTFGYPCFRSQAIPIVVLFTDDPFNNGPPRYTANYNDDEQTPALYDASYALNGKAPTDGFVLYTQASAETFATAYNLPEVTDRFVIAAGDLHGMSGDYPPSVTGCSADADSPEALYRFTLQSQTTLQFGLNTSLDDNYDDSGDVIGFGTSTANKPSPATEGPIILSLYRGEAESTGGEVKVADTRENKIDSGPDQTYLTYTGTSAGANSQRGLLGGISGCRADGETNQVAFTFRPATNAGLVIDAQQSEFNAVVSLHEGLPNALPANPTPVELRGADNVNDTFDTAIAIDGSDMLIDGDYVTYKGDLSQLRDSGTASGAINTAAGVVGLADYESPAVDCSATPGGPDAVFSFRVAAATRVRIDTEGSLANTLVSLHSPNADPVEFGCDVDSGPNGSAWIEPDLLPGTYYIVVKGESAGQTGAYQLNVRDVLAQATSDRWLSCAEHNSRIVANVVAGRDYTVLLKGGARFEQGNYTVKLYDPIGLTTIAGNRLDCITACPDNAPYNDSTSSRYCLRDNRRYTSFSRTLDAGTYYLSVKSRHKDEAGFYELQIGDPARGSNQSTYVPKTWGDMIPVLERTGAKILPVLSCSTRRGEDPGNRCAGTLAQARDLAATSGAKDKAGVGLTQFINRNGTGIGSDLALAVRDLANYLSMDITLSVVNNPGFQIKIQKCPTRGDPTLVGCDSLTTGCADPDPALPRNRIHDCTPGAVPKFAVEFTNPEAPSNVRRNPADPNGGYHFKLQLLGDDRFLLEEIPVYIIPTGVTGPPPGVEGGPNSFIEMGSYEQQFFGVGCSYYEAEGEGPEEKSCEDKIDNNADGSGAIDLGIDGNMDGDLTDPEDPRADPGCLPGSCVDGINNDGDRDGTTELSDYQDPDCATNSTPDWSDLFFEAYVPEGTRIEFSYCTGLSPEDLEGCVYSTVATVTSFGSCRVDSECRKMVGTEFKEGFCGVAGQCLEIDPPKLGEVCMTDDDCPNGASNPRAIVSICDQTVNRCRFVTPPADLGAALPDGDNGKAYGKLKITLSANEDASESPVLYNWEARYICREIQ